MGTLYLVQWSALRTSTAGGTGVIPGQGTKIQHAAQYVSTALTAQSPPPKKSALKYF